MAYTVEEKAIAVEIIRRSGGLKDNAIEDIRQALNAPGLSKSTIHSWLPKSDTPSTRAGKSNKPNKRSKIKPNGKKNEPPQPPPHLDADLQAKVSDTLDNLFEQVARRYLEHATKDEAVAKASGKDAVTAAAIAVDKMRLLRNLPTEIVEILPVVQQLYDVMLEKKLNPQYVFSRMFDRIANTPADD